MNLIVEIGENFGIIKVFNDFRLIQFSAVKMDWAEILLGNCKGLIIIGIPTFLLNLCLG